MAEAFRADPETLADALERMDEFARFAEGMMTEIGALLINLHLAWSGEGATAHAEAHRRWARGEDLMREALARLRAAGTKARDNYARVISTNLEMWS